MMRATMRSTTVARDSTRTSIAAPVPLECPPGWTYNPSTWAQRVPLALLALAGFAIAGYLAAYQWGIVATVWDPFFGDGSNVILHSWVSRILPIPDAALGALGYLVDAATGLIGGRERWRTKPWIVVLFGIAVGPLGAMSVILVILQPVMFDAWCTLCIASACISVAMIGPALDEVLASLQYLRRVRASHRSLNRAFWGISDATPSRTRAVGIVRSCGHTLQ